MRPIVGTFEFNANESVGRSDNESCGAGQTDNESSDWFGQLARPLLAGSDAGFALHIITGFLPGTCARYVAKSAASRRQPPGYFIRKLLQSEQGETWLNALMDGSNPRWWFEHQRAAADRTKLAAIRTILDS